MYWGINLNSHLVWTMQQLSGKQILQGRLARAWIDWIHHAGPVCRGIHFRFCRSGCAPARGRGAPGGGNSPSAWTTVWHTEGTAHSTPPLGESPVKTAIQYRSRLIKGVARNGKDINRITQALTQREQWSWVQYEVSPLLFGFRDWI